MYLSSLLRTASPVPSSEKSLSTFSMPRFSFSSIRLRISWTWTPSPARSAKSCTLVLHASSRARWKGFTTLVFFGKPQKPSCFLWRQLHFFDRVLPGAWLRRKSWLTVTHLMSWYLALGKRKSKESYQCQDRHVQTRLE